MLRDQLKTLFKNSSPTTVVFSLRSLSFFPTSLHVVSHCSSLHILFLSHQFTLLSGSFLQPLRSLACDGAWSSLPPGLAPPRMLLRTPRISESSASASIPASVGPLVLLREGPKHYCSKSRPFSGSRRNVGPSLYCSSAGAAALQAASLSAWTESVPHNQVVEIL